MRLKRLLCAVLIFVFAVLLCGCDLFTVDTDQLLSPPQLTGDMHPIQEAINRSVDTPYTLKYPSKGNYRSAVILNDVNNDNVFEAFAFYSVEEKESITMHINVVCMKDGKWKSVSDQKITASGVDQIDFRDLNSDGIFEIIVGWEMYGNSEKQLAVYNFEENTLSQRMLQPYTNFLSCDLDQDGENEIFIQLLSVTDSTNRASLYHLEESGVVEIAGCNLDKKVKTVSNPVLSTLSSGQPAIFIDAAKSFGTITEVIFMAKGELVNPLLDKETGENTITLRTTQIACKDINVDGILEIPIAVPMPSSMPSRENSELSEKLYYTKWSSFNGETLIEQEITLLNLVDGYYLIVPEKWVGQITLERDAQKRTRTIYSYDNSTGMIGDMLAYIEAIPLKNWPKRKESLSGMVEIYRSPNFVFVGKANKTENALSISDDELKKMFRISE